MSILSTSPVNTRHFDMEIASALGSFEAAVILQQLHYWTQKEGIGVIVDKEKYIYNTFEQWVKNQFTFLSVWKFRKAMNVLRSLSMVKVIRYKSREWNQTNYYSLNYEKLREWAEAESIEISEMCNSTAQDEKTQTLEMKKTEASLYESKITTKEKTAKQGNLLTNKSNSIAAATPKKALKEKRNPNSHLAKLNTPLGQKNVKSKQNQQNTGEETNTLQVDYIVNLEWKELIPELDSTGILINKTVTSLLKLYPKEKVESAIALFKTRKREQHIPNPAGYFISALKEDWAGKNLEGAALKIDTASVFRHWYDLARKLGYCSGQEMRKGEQWVCVSGTWEKWSYAVGRGYSLDYLKKVAKRNKNQ